MTDHAAERSPVDIIRCIYDAYDSGDVSTPMAYYDENIETYISDFVPWGGSRKGSRAFWEASQLLRQLGAAIFEPSEIIDCGREVISVGRMTGFLHDSGVSFDVQSVHVWTFENGKIIRFAHYVDQGFNAVLTSAA
jgi:ketosteroid isomerase-like protein